jgi:hypothetical protein
MAELSPFEIAARTEDALRLSASLKSLNPIYAALVDARTGETFGVIDVPLRVEWF